MVVTAPGDGQVAERASAAAAQWRPGSRVTDVEPMHGGASSVTYQAELSGPDIGQRIVLKVAPAGLAPIRNRDVLRQATILRYLADRPGIRTPRVLFEQPGESLDLPPFFAMEFVDGECIEPILDDPLPVMPAPDVVAARATAAARMLAALHGVAVGSGMLADEPVQGLDAEVERWNRAFATVGAELQFDAHRCCSRLLETVPPALPSVLLHGDYRLGNTLCLNHEVRAVIDWEIWGVGDPRVDLLWFLLFTDPSRLPTAPRAAPGMPSVPELVAEYTSALGVRSLPDLDWFDALIQFKQAAVTALIVKHNRRRPIPDARLERSSLQIEPLIRRALGLLG